MNDLYIYGSSGHGLVIYDIAVSCGYKKITFIDDGDNEFDTFDDIKENNNIPIIIAIGINSIRKQIFKKVKFFGFNIVTLIHPSSIVSQDVKIDEGTVIMPNAVINANTYIGKSVIINSSSVIEHECIVNDFSHISPNVSLAGNVKIGKLTHIGIGSTVIQGITIGKKSIIGAGSVVVKNIKKYKKAYGNPCREIEGLEE